jgi:hypothetical protein
MEKCEKCGIRFTALAICDNADCPGSVVDPSEEQEVLRQHKRKRGWVLIYGLGIGALLATAVNYLTR